MNKTNGVDSMDYENDNEDDVSNIKEILISSNNEKQ